MQPQDPNSAIFFRNANGILSYSFNGNTYTINLQGDVFKIPQKISNLVNNTEYQISAIPTSDGIPTFILIPKAQRIYMGGGGSKAQGPAGLVNPIYGQAYTKTTQSVNTGDAVIWDAIQNGLGVILSPTNKDIQVSTTGIYQIEWIIEGEQNT